jgi:pseudaminic acid cytidylyltransferase
MRLAVIPARGGSKRIPRKNIKPFAGRPMIHHAILAARDCGLFDRIVVSTEDAEVAEVARAGGAEVPFVRPARLADDFAATVPVIAHAVQALDESGWRARQVCCIYPCVPLLRPERLAEALGLLERDGVPYVFAVVPFESPIQRALRRLDDGATRPFLPQHANTRTQDLEPAFHDAGQFYWGTADAWKSGLDVHGNGHSIVLPRDCVVDIDEPADWARAEALHRHAAARISP